MIRMRKTIVSILAISLCSAALAVIYALRHNPVLVGFGGDVHSHHSQQILNPFRSRLPENVAKDFFEVLRGPDCETTLGKMERNLQRITATCSEERKYPVMKSKIEAIGHDNDRILLRYEVYRGGPQGGSKSPFWVWISNLDGQWVVTGYETWY